MIPKFKMMDLTIKRTIPASPSEVFRAWLNPKFPGNPWHKMDKLIFNPKVGGFFYRMHLTDGEEMPHYGRFLVLDRPKKIQHTWMSKHTHGVESVVTVTFRKEGDDTLLTIYHANLPDDKFGQLHEYGWNHYLDLIKETFSKKSKTKNQKRKK